MRSQALVSVVICTFNGAKFLEPQIESVLDQTYKNIEVVVCDDGSSDGTVATVKRYEAIDNRIKLYQNAENLGYIKNFEKGVNLVSGEYIAFCDQDDVWDLSKIQTMMDYAQSGNLVYHDSAIVSEDLSQQFYKMSDEKFMISGNCARALLINNCVSGHATLAQTGFVKSCMPFPIAVPHDWWLAMNASIGDGLIYVDQALVKYRQHGSNVILKSGSKLDARTVVARKRERFAALSKPLLAVHSHTALSRFVASYLGTSFKDRIYRTTYALINNKQLFAIFKKNSLQRYFASIQLFFNIR
ncbi:MAG: glycosyltransferase family 2 protein [Nonlabens sp.]